MPAENVLPSLATGAMQQIPLPLLTRPEPTLASFIAGANGLALAQLASWLPPRGPQPPLYLWGASGSGKTHLLRALAARARALGAAVCWFDATTPAPWPADDGQATPTLLLLDGCEGFDAAQQHAAFALFAGSAGQPCQVAAAGRLPPVDLPLRDDLRSRLGWGTVLALEALGEDDSRAALRAAAHARGLRLGDELVQYLRTRFARDLKHQVALLDRLDAYAYARRRAVTLPLLRELLGDPAPAVPAGDRPADPPDGGSP